MSPFCSPMTRECWGLAGRQHSTAQHREMVHNISKTEIPWGPSAQPSSQCWCGLCPLGPVPPVRGSSIGKALQGEWDRVWGEATDRPLPPMAGPTSALGSLPGGRPALYKTSPGREVLTGYLSCAGDRVKEKRNTKRVKQNGERERRRDQRNRERREMRQK